MSGGFKYLEGGPLKAPDDVVVDDYYANQKGYKPGSKIKMLNREWRISGIMESGKLAHIVVPLATLQEQTGNPAKISQIYLKLDDPAHTQDVVKDLKSNPDL